jgi:hypothetical protein
MRGTITKYRRNGTVQSWGYYFRQRQEPGAWKQITKSGFATKRAAEQALREALIEAGLQNEQMLAEPEPIPTFDELLEQFLSGADCTLGTLEAYRKQSRYPSREFGSRPIDTITTEDL